MPLLALLGSAAVRWLVPSAAIWIAGHGVGEAGEGVREVASAGSKSVLTLAAAAGVGAFAMSYFGGRRVRR